jgi:hypothetical protein
MYFERIAAVRFIIDPLQERNSKENEGNLQC